MFKEKSGRCNIPISIELWPYYSVNYMKDSLADGLTTSTSDIVVLTYSSRSPHYEDCKCYYLMAT